MSKSDFVIRFLDIFCGVTSNLPTGGDRGAGIWMLGGALTASGGGEIGAMVGCWLTCCW